MEAGKESYQEQLMGNLDYLVKSEELFETILTPEERTARLYTLKQSVDIEMKVI